MIPIPGFFDVIGGTTSALRKRAERAAVAGDMTKAASLWRRLAGKGDAHAAYRLGECHERGDGVLQSFVIAQHWYRQAAEAGLLSACAKLGELYLSGRPATLSVSGVLGESPALAGLQANTKAIGADPVEAAHWNRIAAGHDPAAAARLGQQAAAGCGMPLDYDEAERAFAIAAAAGDPAGMVGLGKLYAGGHGRPCDPMAAATLFEDAVKAGSTEARLCLAALILQAGSDADAMSRAADLLQAAAEDGHVEAMYRLGELRRAGLGGAGDGSGADSSAERWLRRAAACGHRDAMFALAGLLAQDPHPDHGAAAGFLREAAERGSAAAQYALGECFAAGLGVPPDAAQAAFWFGEAAAQGVAAALDRIGGLHASGEGPAQDYAAAHDWFARAADTDLPDGHFHLGTVQLHGLGVATDPDRALESYRRAADGGSAEAALSLGLLYARGETVAQDFAAAASHYTQAIALGSSEARINLALLMIQGLGDAGEAQEGFDLLNAAAEHGDPDAMWALHQLFEERNDHEHSPADPAAAARWLRAAAEAGHASAQTLLAQRMFEGAAMEARDPRGAVAWMVRAARQGDVFAQAWLGDVLATGQGVPADPVAARDWYLGAARRGHIGALQALTAMVMPEDDTQWGHAVFALWLKRAEAGEALAQRMVGDYLAHGIGCQRSPEQAARWLRAAAAQGNAAAAVIVAGLILNGDVPPVAPSEVLDRLTAAANDDDPDAAYNLGFVFEHGLGIDADPAEARGWYESAARRGHPRAPQALLTLGARDTDRMG